jgi:hypothetical protein
MNEQYVMANIQLPIRIHPDGSTEPLAEYMTFLLEKCDKLPDNIVPNNAKTEFAEKIRGFLNSYEQPRPTTQVSAPIPYTLTVTYQELSERPKKSSIHNTSFKNKRNPYTRYTAKNYSNS